MSKDLFNLVVNEGVFRALNFSFQKMSEKRLKTFFQATRMTRTRRAGIALLTAAAMLITPLGSMGGFFALDARAAITEVDQEDEVTVNLAAEAPVQVTFTVYAEDGDEGDYTAVVTDRSDADVSGIEVIETDDVAVTIAEDEGNYTGTLTLELSTEYLKTGGEELLKLTLSDVDESLPDLSYDFVLEIDKLVPTVTFNATETEAYDGDPIDVSGYFTIATADATAGVGVESYGVTAGTGVGTLSGSNLSVTQLGTFTISMTTGETAAYESKVSTLTLTVNKGSQPAPVITINSGAESIEKEVGDVDFNISTVVTVTNAETSGEAQIALTWTSSNTDVATFSTSISGLVTIVGAGETDITAIFTETTNYNASVASEAITLKVSAAEPSLTPVIKSVTQTSLPNATEAIFAVTTENIGDGTYDVTVVEKNEDSLPEGLELDGEEIVITDNAGTITLLIDDEDLEPGKHTLELVIEDADGDSTDTAAFAFDLVYRPRYDGDLEITYDSGEVAYADTAGSRELTFKVESDEEALPDGTYPVEIKMVGEDVGTGDPVYFDHAGVTVKGGELEFEGDEATLTLEVDPGVLPGEWYFAIFLDDAVGRGEFEVALGEGLTAEATADIKVPATDTGLREINLHPDGLIEFTIVDEFDYGFVTDIDIDEFTDDSDILGDSPSVEPYWTGTADPDYDLPSGYRLKYQGSGETTGSATLELEVSTAFYKPITLTLTFVATEKEAVTIEGFEALDAIYNGEAQPGFKQVGDIVFLTEYGVDVTDEITLTQDPFAPEDGEAGAWLDLAYAQDDEPLGAAPTEVGTLYSVTITLMGSDDFQGSVEFSFEIGKAAPNVVWPNNLSASADQTLSDLGTQLSPWNARQDDENNDLTSGAFTWKAAGTTSVGSVGNPRHMLVFTPADEDNFSVVENTVPVNVSRGYPVVYWPTGQLASYGGTLADVPAEAFPMGDKPDPGDPDATPGTFSWASPLNTPIVGDVGEEVGPFSLRFTPTDSNSFVRRTEDITLWVVAADPPIVWVEDAEEAGRVATYGDTLADVDLILSYITDVAGELAWKDDLTTPVGDAGTNSFDVIFTPDDDGSYKDAETSLDILVEKAEPVVYWPDGLTAKYGETLADVDIASETNQKPGDDDPEPTLGAFSWADASEPVGDVGEQTHNAIFTPTEVVNFETVESSVTIDVDKGDQVDFIITAIGAVTYGDDDIELVTTGGSTDGAVEFDIADALDKAEIATITKDGVLTILGVGEITVVATKAGDANYLAAEASLVIDIQKAPGLLAAGVEVYVNSDDTDEQSLNLDAAIVLRHPDFAVPFNVGGIEYSVVEGSYADEDSGSEVLKGFDDTSADAIDADGNLIFTGNEKTTGTASLIIKVTTGFFEPAYALVTLHATEKDAVEITGVVGVDADYNPDEDGITGYDDTDLAYYVLPRTDNDEPVEDDDGDLVALYYEFNDTSGVFDVLVDTTDEDGPTQAGDYEVLLTLTDDTNYVGSVRIPFSIHKIYAEPSAWPDDLEAIWGDELGDVDLTDYNDAETDGEFSWPMADVKIRPVTVAEPVEYILLFENTSAKAENYITASETVEIEVDRAPNGLEADQNATVQYAGAPIDLTAVLAGEMDLEDFLEFGGVLEFSLDDETTLSDLGEGTITDGMLDVTSLADGGDFALLIEAEPTDTHVGTAEALAFTLTVEKEKAELTAPDDFGLEYTVWNDFHPEIEFGVVGDFVNWSELEFQFSSTADAFEDQTEYGQDDWIFVEDIDGGYSVTVDVRIAETELYAASDPITATVDIPIFMRAFEITLGDEVGISTAEITVNRGDLQLHIENIRPNTTDDDDDPEDDTVTWYVAPADRQYISVDADGLVRASGKDTPDGQPAVVRATANDERGEVREVYISVENQRDSAVLVNINPGQSVLVKGEKIANDTATFTATLSGQNIDADAVVNWSVRDADTDYVWVQPVDASGGPVAESNIVEVTRERYGPDAPPTGYTVELTATYTTYEGRVYQDKVRIELFDAGDFGMSLLANSVSVNAAKKTGGSIPIRLSGMVDLPEDYVIGENGSNVIQDIKLISGTGDTNPVSGTGTEVSTFKAWPSADNSAIEFAADLKDHDGKTATAKKASNVNVWILPIGGDAANAADWVAASTTTGNHDRITLNVNTTYPRFSFSVAPGLDLFKPANEAVISVVATNDRAAVFSFENLVVQANHATRLTRVSDSAVKLGEDPKTGTYRANVTLADVDAVQGYRRLNASGTNTFTVSVRVQNSRPNLGLSRSSLSMRHHEDAGAGSVTINLTSRTKNRSVASWGTITDIRLLDPNGDLVDGWDSGSWSFDDPAGSGLATLTIPGNLPANVGKARYQVEVTYDGGVSVVATPNLRLRITNTDKPTLTASPKSITLNGGQWDEAARINVATNPLNLAPDMVLEYRVGSGKNATWHELIGSGFDPTNPTVGAYVHTIGGEEYYFIGAVSISGSSIEVEIDDYEIREAAEAANASQRFTKNLVLNLRVRDKNERPANASRDTTTPAVKLTITPPRAATASVRASGRIDVINPASLMSVNVTLRNTTAIISEVVLYDQPAGSTGNNKPGYWPNMGAESKHYIAEVTSGRSFNIVMKNDLNSDREAQQGFGYVVPGIRQNLSWRIILDNGQQIDSWSNTFRSAGRYNVKDAAINVTPRQNAAKGQSSKSAVTLYNSSPYRSETATIALTGAAAAFDVEHVTIGGARLVKGVPQSANERLGFAAPTGLELTRAGITDWTFRMLSQEDGIRGALSPVKGKLKSSYTVNVELWPVGSYQMDEFGEAILDGAGRPQPILNSKNKNATKPIVVKVKVNVR